MHTLRVRSTMLAFLYRTNLLLPGLKSSCVTEWHRVTIGWITSQCAIRHDILWRWWSAMTITGSIWEQHKLSRWHRRAFFAKCLKQERNSVWNLLPYCRYSEQYVPKGSMDDLMGVELHIIEFQNARDRKKKRPGRRHLFKTQIRHFVNHFAHTQLARHSVGQATPSIRKVGKCRESQRPHWTRNLYRRSSRISWSNATPRSCFGRAHCPCQGIDWRLRGTGPSHKRSPQDTSMVGSKRRSFWSCSLSDWEPQCGYQHDGCLPKVPTSHCFRRGAL